VPLRRKSAELIHRIVHPRTTVRGRLALLYGGVFLASGVVLVAIIYLLVNDASRDDASQVASAVHVTPGPSGSVLQPAVQQRNLDLHSLLVGSSVALAIMAAGSVVLGWLVAGRVLRPLRSITAATRQISARNLHERLALDGPPDEITELGATIDGLLTRLESAFDAQRQFVANASHELWTPVTVSQAMLQVALASPNTTLTSLKATCEDVLETGKQQQQLIEALLALARSAQGLDRRAPFDLAIIASQAVEGRRDHPEDHDIRIETTLAAALTAGDPAMVQSLVANLIDNAIRHNKPGGRAQITTTTTAGQATIQVSNSGPVIPADQVDRLFRPFQQLGDQRTHATGHGLGLAIVQAIADAHQAILTAHARPEGGLDIQVRFPPPNRQPDRSTSERHAPNQPQRPRLSVH
jgi:signal transduction histidine kinase